MGSEDVFEPETLPHIPGDPPGREFGSTRTETGAPKPNRKAPELSQNSRPDSGLKSFSATDIAAIDLANQACDPSLLYLIAPEYCLRHGILPWRRIGNMTIIAAADPAEFRQIQPELTAIFGPVFSAYVPITDIHTCLSRMRSSYFSERANLVCPEEFSCRAWLGKAKGQRVVTTLCILAMLSLTFPATVLHVIVLWVFLNLVATTFLRLTALLTQMSKSSTGTGADAQQFSPLVPDTDLPLVSMIVPLFREEAILPALIDRLKTTDYPKDRLEVCLVLESNDHYTRAALRNIALPDWMRVLIVPRSTLQTKPRAMNYALNFCRGAYIGIYDAEDAPEADQIRRIIAHFKTAGPNVACVQGYLDYYNARQNWLTRCFTIEYALWFRVVLHGVDNLGLPVPLGGTTVFFRRDALDAIGAWDAHNVTEDADLGFRLARLGYRCDFVPTSTYEEASATLKTWIRQRSRWLKGYAITWGTHMRNPVRLWRDLGPAGFFAFQVLLLGTVTTFLLAPMIWSLWLVMLGGSPPFYGLIAPWIWQTLAVAFAVSELVLTTLGFYAVSGKAHRHLIFYVPTMILYWPIGTLAVFKGIYELVRSPFYWDKTQHGQHQNPATTPD